MRLRPMLPRVCDPIGIVRGLEHHLYCRNSQRQFVNSLRKVLRMPHDVRHIPMAPRHVPAHAIAEVRGRPAGRRGRLQRPVRRELCTAGREQVEDLRERGRAVPEVAVLAVPAVLAEPVLAKSATLAEPAALPKPTARLAKARHARAEPVPERKVLVRPRARHCMRRQPRVRGEDAGAHRGRARRAGRRSARRAPRRARGGTPTRPRRSARAWRG
jgi:hypothetical protein